jgi:hypothetical protein
VGICVHTYGMAPTSGTILQAPVLDSTTLRLCEDAFSRTIGPRDTVDLPLPVSALEFVLVLDRGVSWWELHIAKFNRQVLGL